MKMRKLKRSVLVAAGATIDEDLPALAPNKNIVLKQFGAIDINNGDNKSSVYILQWGSPGSFEILKVLSLTGATQETAFGKGHVLEGDGTKFLRMKCTNTSGSPKDLVAWVEGDQG